MIIKLFENQEQPSVFGEKPTKLKVFKNFMFLKSKYFILYIYPLNMYIY